MRLGGDITKQLDEAFRDVDPEAFRIVVRNGMIALASFGPAELAERAAVEIRSELAYAHRMIRIAVDAGWVTLEGEVEWNYQKNGAETAVRRMPWAKGIRNDIHVKPGTEAVDVTRRIEAEFRSHAEPDMEARVRAWAESDRPEEAARTTALTSS